MIVLLGFSSRWYMRLSVCVLLLVSMICVGFVWMLCCVSCYVSCWCSVGRLSGVV